MGLFGPSKVEQEQLYAAMRDTARNVLDGLKVKPYTQTEENGRTKVVPDWSEGWRSVPFEFVEPMSEHLRTLVTVVYEPRCGTLEGFAQGLNRKEMLEVVAVAVNVVAAFRGGAVNTSVRKAYRAATWTKCSEGLAHCLDGKEPLLGFGLEDLYLPCAELCLPFFKDEAELREALQEAGKNGVSLTSNEPMDILGHIPTTYDPSKAHFCTPAQLERLVEQGRELKAKLQAEREARKADKR